MAIYYKAVRPDGTDFHTHRVDYAALCGTGERLPVKPEVEHPRCCTDRVYHASTSKADTLIGGSWPCRLFEVEGDAVAEEDNKRGFYTLRVIRELPAWEALGPNGEAVAELIEKVSQVTGDQMRELDAARRAARDAAWDAAWDAVEDAAWDAARDAARDAAGDAAENAARTAAANATWTATWTAAAAGTAVWIAAEDAAGALVVKDLISEEHFNTLYGPWASVMDV